MLISRIPQLNEKLRSVIEILGILLLLSLINRRVKSNQLFWSGNLETLCNDVEISLMALEDTIDAAECQDKQLEKKIQSAMYQERRRAEFAELSGMF